MASRPDLSASQQRIVNRYYDNLDAITLTKLQELVSELYLADEKAVGRVWKRIETALAKSPAKAAAVGRVLESRDVEAFARLVQDLSKI
ncbi:MAG: hypothetical protein Q9O74_06845 [Planctomycetota bacterium]|nr:hypothetical protein [Planctomycetota bacterium]